MTLLLVDSSRTKSRFSSHQAVEWKRAFLGPLVVVVEAEEGDLWASLFERARVHFLV
jgi:hypothetical protein